MPFYYLLFASKPQKENTSVAHEFRLEDVRRQTSAEVFLSACLNQSNYFINSMIIELAKTVDAEEHTFHHSL